MLLYDIIRVGGQIFIKIVCKRPVLIIRYKTVDKGLKGRKFL